jgi:hypothetical protein
MPEWARRSTRTRSRTFKEQDVIGLAASGRYKAILGQRDQPARKNRISGWLAAKVINRQTGCFEIPNYFWTGLFRKSSPELVVLTAGKF